MKTKLISTLKKELLIIEFPEGYELAGVTHGAIHYYDNQMNYEDYPLSILVEGSYTLLGSPDEIKEEDARELVQTDKFGLYRNYSIKGMKFHGGITATTSLLSAIETVVFWENHKTFGDFLYSPKKWEVVERNTFDKNRTLIFVKN